MGMPLDGISSEEAFEKVRRGLAEGRGGRVLTPNLDILRRYCQSSTLPALFEDVELLLPDGMPLVWACRLQGTPVVERITGTDMLWGMAAAAAGADASLFLVGGRAGVARRAGEVILAAHPTLRLDSRPLYVELDSPITEQVREVSDLLVNERPDVVYLGLPFEVQAHLMDELHPRLPATWFLGMGSSFDFLTGDRQRAPVWLQRIGLEWAHRVVLEPGVRRRYLVEGLPFAARLGLHSVAAGMQRWRSDRTPVRVNR
jgi:N-acetylglucosaminyldiphosphoundecaprenol N-acetyl-beta-D-mannosaminyltransferase